ncbi:hypothetical protein QBC34DRAFT_444224 [Podospora aff. communis PSN243]|uniref:Uncharacterized protein n=1 Tax=Podospora aff. communis PSN243 TaxID=3040156 RepID=A0AAV9G3I5_9PEZI|nr:hypothetical protein QBC34DRAFT_444224 [Podospora aff. communis PSN243]
MEHQDVLVNILSTLHRLEARFDDQSDRLTIIERSVSPAPEPSLRRSTSTRTWASTRPSTRPSVDQMTAEYKTSIAEIRNRFTFIDDSESEHSVRREHAEKDGDLQSVSVYSRPQSQLQLELVPPPRNPDRDKAPELIAVRYEDIVDSPEPMSSGASSISSNQFSQSNSPAASSATTPGYAGNVTFSDYMDNGSNRSSRSRDNIRASVSQHAANLRNLSNVWLQKAVHNLYVAVDVLPDRMETIKNSAARVSQTCFKAVRRAASCVGRKMVEQQLKRLDASA